MLTFCKFGIFSKLTFSENSFRTTVKGLVGPDLGPNVCKGYQQTTLTDKRVKKTMQNENIYGNIYKNQYWAGRVYGLCVFYDGSTQRLTERNSGEAGD